MHQEALTQPTLGGARSLRGPKLAAAAIFLLGGGLALTLGWQLHDGVQSNAEQRFDQQVRLLVDELTNAFEKPQLALASLAGIHAADGGFTRQKFRAYWAARGFQKDFRGVRGFGVIENVRRTDLAAFVARQRRTGVIDYEVKTNDSTRDMYVINLVEPVERNRAAVGLDIGREAVRRAGAEQALREGSPTLTGVITLVQDERRGPGFLLLVPLYRGGGVPDTVQQRVAAHAGFVYCPITADELFAPLTTLTGGQSEFEIHADSAPGAQTLVFDSRQTGEQAPANAKIPTAHQAAFQRGVAVTVANRVLNLTVRSTPAFEAGIDRNQGVLAGAGGVLLSGLLALAFWLIASGRARAEARARELTGEMQRLALVAERTNNSVIIADADNRIVWVNDAFTRLCGQTLDEVKGRRASEVRGGAQDPQAPRRIREALERGEGLNIETVNQAKDGRAYWVDLDLQPLRDEAGRHAGYVAVERDITSFREAQERERQHAAQLAAALRDGQALMDTINTHAIVSEAGRDGRITRVNDAFCRISGYSREELVGQDHRVVNSGVQDRAFWQAMWRSIGSGKPWRGQICNRAKDGSLYWVDSIIAPFRDADGRIERYVSIRFDVTDRRRLYEEAQQRGHLLAAIVENVPGALCAFDENLDLVIKNRQFHELLGFPDALFEQTPVRYETLIRHEARRGEYGPGAVDDIVARAVRLARRSTPATFERARPNGQILEIHTQPMAGGGVVMTTLDITRRKQAEKEARQADEMLRQAINTLDEAFVIYDDRDRLLICNQRYRDTYPISAAAMKPGATFEEIVRHGAERGEYPAAVGRVDEWVAERVARHVRADSDHIQELGNGCFVRVVERKTSDGYIVGFRIDITDLVRARLAAEEASKSKSQFLANMSHEIRTPMNAILGMLDLLGHTELSARQRDYVDKTDSAARSLLGLLNDILDFSKVEAGKLTLESVPFRMDALMRDLAVILSSSTGEKPVEVLFDIDPRLPDSLVGDSLRLKQVLINLAGNAIKFTERGMVLVHIEARESRPDHVLLEFSVRDTGIGIPPEHLQRIFEGFSQAEASTTRRFGGTGLGLAISSRLVSLMGGRLEVQSELGQGSRFHFRLDLPVAHDATHAMNAPRQVELRQLQVLVIDDNPVARQILQAMMAPMGWQAECVASGEEALRLIRERIARGRRPHDAVFVDWQMPGLNGWDTCRQIRRLLTDPQSPILIMVTAHGREPLSRRAPEEQALLNGFLVKPVTPSMLLDAVMEARRGVLDHGVAVVPATKRLQGMRVLLVEDNKINQQVAQEVLEREGAHVALADNGELGVQAIATADPPWDAVLMDVQMPVMDGYAATRKVREELGLKDLPIIAMTANAMESDRQDALAAGMNDHVGKPFNLDELVAVMLRLSGKAAPAADALPPATTPPAPGATGQPALPDHAGEFDIRTTLLRMGGDADLLARMLQGFAHDLPRQPRDLAALLAEGKADEARRLLHTLKGTAATMGATRLPKVAAEAEHHLRAGDTATGEEARQLLDRVRAAADSAAADLAPLLRQLEHDTTNTAPTAPLDPGALRTDLQELQALLRKSDLGGLEVFARLRARHGPALGQELRALDEALAGLDFAQADRLCDTLRQRYTV